MLAVQGEPVAGAQQDAQVGAGDQACVAAIVHHGHERAGVVAKAAVDLLDGQADLDGFPVLHQFGQISHVPGAQGGTGFGLRR